MYVIYPAIYQDAWNINIRLHIWLRRFCLILAYKWAFWLLWPVEKWRSNQRAPSTWAGTLVKTTEQGRCENKVTRGPKERAGAIKNKSGGYWNQDISKLQKETKIARKRSGGLSSRNTPWVLAFAWTSSPSVTKVPMQYWSKRKEGLTLPENRQNNRLSGVNFKSWALLRRRFFWLHHPRVQTSEFCFWIA